MCSNLLPNTTVVPPLSISCKPMEKPRNSHFPYSLILVRLLALHDENTLLGLK